MRKLTGADQECHQAEIEFQSACLYAKLLHLEDYELPIQVLRHKVEMKQTWDLEQAEKRRVEEQAEKRRVEEQRAYDETRRINDTDKNTRRAEARRVEQRRVEQQGIEQQRADDEAELHERKNC